MRVGEEQVPWDATWNHFLIGDVTAVLRRVVESARVLNDADAATLLLYDPERTLFVPNGAVGLDERWLQRQGLQAAQSLAQRAVDATGCFAQ